MAFEGDNTAREFEAMLRRQIRRGGAPAAACAGFDPETASAYVEHALGGAAHTRYEEHLADCPSCRHQVVELFRLIRPETVPLPVAQPEPPRSFFARWFDFSAWQWGLAAAGGVCVILLSVAIFRFAPRRLNETAANAKIGDTVSAPESLARNAQPTQQPPPASSSASAVTSAKPAQIQPPGRSQTGEAEAQAARAEATMPLAAPAPSAAIASLPTSSINFKQALRNVIAGTVSDANGAMIANAQIKLIDPASQQARATTRTDASGQFGFGNIPQGNYLVEAQAPGFKTLQAPAAVQDLPRKANDQLALKLEVGAMAETITLADVEARQSSVGGVIKPPPGNPPPPPPPNEIKLSADKKDAERMAELVKPGTAAGRGGSGASRASDEARRAAPQKSKDQAGQAGSEKKEVAAAAPLPRPSATATESRLRNNEAEQAKGAASVGGVAALPKTPINGRIDSVSAEKSLALPTKKISGKTFRLEHGAWLDADYKLGDKLPLTHLKRNSHEFKQTLAALPALKPFFKLGLVTVVWQGKVYEVRNKN